MATSHTKALLDQAISDSCAEVRELDELDPSPVIAWVTIALVDDGGDEEAGFVILAPDGQRGVLTRGILLDALDVVRLTGGTVDRG